MQNSRRMANHTVCLFDKPECLPARQKRTHQKFCVLDTFLLFGFHQKLNQQKSFNRTAAIRQFACYMAHHPKEDNLPQVAKISLKVQNNFSCGTYNSRRKIVACITVKFPSSKRKTKIAIKHLTLRLCQQ